jgi:imidazolonepropionase-like amidohydrolase
MSKKRTLLLVFTASVLTAPLALAGCRHPSTAARPASQATPVGTFTIRDVRVFDGERVLDHRSVVVADGRIIRVGAVAATAGLSDVDGRGRTLLPGLIDAHVHVADQVEEALAQAASLGATTVIDMWNGGERLPKIKQAEAADAPDLASVVTAGTGATAPGGHPSQMGGPPFPTISGPDEAQAFVDARIAEGSDFIKIIYDDLKELGFQPVPMLGRETLAALVEAAHRRGKLAVVHISTESQARDAIAVGADGLAHLFIGETRPEDFGVFAREHRTFVIPTLSILAVSCGRSEGARLRADGSLQPFILPAWRERLAMSWSQAPQPCKATGEALRQLRDAEVPILAGTDSPAPGTTYGASLHGELDLLVREGLTPVQALTAATSAAARAFRLDDRGFVRPGLRGDLVLVEGNPTVDILATRRIVTVWKAGLEVRRRRF